MLRQILKLLLVLVVSVGLLWLVLALLFSYRPSVDIAGAAAAQRLQEVTGIRAEEFLEPRCYFKVGLRSMYPLYVFVVAPNTLENLCAKLKLQESGRSQIPIFAKPKWWRERAAKLREPVIYYRDPRHDWELWVVSETGECFLSESRGG